MGHTPPVPEFRYAQFCPLARATEILGERWTLLIVRELLTGPKRFADLRRALPGVSSSVLTVRLARLEELDLVAQRALRPPAASTVYELAEAGRALLPVVLELVRWGVRFLQPPGERDHFEADWLPLGLAGIARRGPSPSIAVAVHLAAADGGVSCQVRGGRRGTVVTREIARPDATLETDSPLAVMALATGMLAPADAVRSGGLRVEGDLDALTRFPELFELAPSGAGHVLGADID